MTHTPGPWTFNKSTKNSNILVGPPGEYYEVARLPENRRSDEREANARLIAAAPELLEALKNLVDTINNNGSTVARLDATALAMAAIAKAEGPTHRVSWNMDTGKEEIEPIDEV